jgi:hypothetical protein
MLICWTPSASGTGELLQILPILRIAVNSNTSGGAVVTREKLADSFTLRLCAVSFTFSGNLLLLEAFRKAG